VVPVLSHYFARRVFVADPPPQLGDVDAAGRVEPDLGRALDVAPLLDEGALSCEDLDPAVLAVGDQDAAVGGHRDAVGQVELARAGAGLAPRMHELAGRRE